MERKKRTDPSIAGWREAQRLAATLGEEVRTTRRRRRLTQAALGARVGLTQGQISRIEQGEAVGTGLPTWIAIGTALGRPLAVGFSRDIEPVGPRDAGHLAAQELLLDLARRTGRTGFFELPTRPTDPAHSIDVGLRDDRHRVLIVNEIWNRIGDVGAGARSTARKVADAAALALFRGYRVAACWLLVDTAANRAIVRRYPEVIRARFPGSSRAWARALTDGTEPPVEPGLVWVDPRAGRITPVRVSG